MQDRPKLLRQDRRAIFISYVVYRAWLAILTYGILAIYDLLSYRNSKLQLLDNSVEVTRGALPTTMTINFEDIAGFSIEQSGIGKKAGYGTVKIHNQDSSIIPFKFVHDPARVAAILHKKVSDVKGDIFTPTEFAQRQAEAYAAKAEQIKADKNSGACPRCGGTNIQAVVEHATLKGTGWSFTRRMCMGCRKKF
jgi:hypothetical protein